MARSTAPSRRRFLLQSARAGAVLGLAPGALGGCTARFLRTSAAYEAWRYPEPALPLPLRIVHAALLAPNPHNTQPWRFVLSDAAVVLKRDPARWLGPMDGLFRELHIGLGCALEHARLAAVAAGQPVTVRVRQAWDQRTDSTGADCAAFADADAVAVLELSGPEPADRERDLELHAAIAARRTHRGPWAEQPLPAGVVSGLRELAVEYYRDHVGISIVEHNSALSALGEHTVAATREIVGDREMNEASEAWFRWTRAEIERHRDGVTLEVQGLSPAMIALARAAGRPSPARSGEHWVRNTERQVGALSAMVLLSTDDRRSLPQQVATGRLYARLALQIERWGLAAHPLNQLPERQDREELLGLDGASARRLAAALEPGAPTGVQLVFRVGHALDPLPHAPRRAVAALLS